MKTCYYCLASGRLLAVEPHSQPGQLMLVCRDREESIVSRWATLARTWEATPPELQRVILANLADYDPPDEFSGTTAIGYLIGGDWRHGRRAVIRLVPGDQAGSR